MPKKQPTPPPPPKPRDASFLPASYWPNASVGQTIAGSIRGVARREAVEKALKEGTLEQLPDFILQDGLSNLQQLQLSRVHPSLTGGEYLPDHLPGEVTIASVCYVGSVGRDVDEIRASLRGGYRWVGESWEGQEIQEDEWTPDEEEGEAEDAPPPKNFCQPVSQNTLAGWIVERVMEVLNDNNFNGGEEWDNLRGFASVSSKHYPTLAVQCEQMIEKEIWDSARGDFQSQEVENLTEELGAEVANLEDSYIEVMTEFAGNCTPQIKERRTQIESAYGRAALLLKLLSPDPERYWEVFGPWSDVELR